MQNITPCRARLLAASLLASVPTTGALAADIALPLNTFLTAQERRSASTYAAPIAPYAGGVLPAFEIKGDVTKMAYRVETQGLTPQQLLDPIEDSLSEAEFEFLFKCEDRFCGGFDFRFSTEILAAPDMFVDLFDFVFLTARRDAGEYVTVLTSRDASSGYIQIIQVSPKGVEQLNTRAIALIESHQTQPSSKPSPKGSLSDRLETNGHIVLSDLAFKTGSSDLGEGDFASLARLSSYLKNNPDRIIALVGHTDSVGSLDGNISLSKRRAASVRARLLSVYGIDQARVQAEGMGYLSPIASNLTAEGREENRRVEVVLLNTE